MAHLARCAGQGVVRHAGHTLARKAWLFRQQSGYSTAYIGSSNLSKAALLDGVEWNVRLSAVGSPAVLEKFDATFDSYWANPEYEEYRPDRDAVRFDLAVAATINDSPDAPPILLDVEPWPHQRQILESLPERERSDRMFVRSVALHTKRIGTTAGRRVRFRSLPAPAARIARVMS